VDIRTGQAVNQVAARMNQRILGTDKPTTCTSPNHWSSFPNLSKSDRRIVSVFLTPFGTFQGSGSGTVPIQDFGTFYVTAGPAAAPVSSLDWAASTPPSLQGGPDEQRS
jgi:hypothetical protein